MLYSQNNRIHPCYTQHYIMAAKQLNDHTNHNNYFTCWSEHTKHSDKPLLNDTMRKLQLLPGIELHPQGWESSTLTTAPISLTTQHQSQSLYKIEALKQQLLYMLIEPTIIFTIWSRLLRQEIILNLENVHFYSFCVRSRQLQRY